MHKFGPEILKKPTIKDKKSMDLSHTEVSQSLNQSEYLKPRFENLAHTFTAKNRNSLKGSVRDWLTVEAKQSKQIFSNGITAHQEESEVESPPHFEI